MGADEYTQWLGIPAGPRPPNPFTLLGLPPNCFDEAKIESAARTRLAQLDRYAIHPERAKREACNRLMNEVARARITLKRLRDSVPGRSSATLDPESLPLLTPLDLQDEADAYLDEIARAVAQTSPAPRTGPHADWAQRLTSWASNPFLLAGCLTALLLAVGVMLYRANQPATSPVQTGSVLPVPPVEHPGPKLTTSRSRESVPQMARASPPAKGVSTRPALSLPADLPLPEPFVPVEFSIDGPKGRETWSHQPDGRWTSVSSKADAAALTYTGRLHENGRAGAVFDRLAGPFQEILIPDPGSATRAEFRTSAGGAWQILGAVSVSRWAKLPGNGSNPESTETRITKTAGRPAANTYLQRAIRAAERIESKPVKAELLQDIILAQIAGDDLKGARESYALLRPLIQSAWSPLGREVFFAAACDDVETADALCAKADPKGLVGVNELFLGNMRYGMAARGRAVAGDFARALKDLDRIPDGAQTRYLATKFRKEVVLEAVQASGLASVTRTISAEPDAGRRDRLWEALAFALAVRGQIPEALDAAKRITETDARLLVTPSITRFQALKDWDGACSEAELLGQYRARAFMLMSAELCDAGQFDRALEAALRSGDESRVVAVAKAAANAGSADIANRAIGACQNHDTPQFLEALAVTQAARGDFSAALSTADSIPHTADHRQPERWLAFAGIASQAARLNRLSEAHLAVSRIEYLPGDPASGDKAWASIADAQAAHGDFAAALQDVRRMSHPDSGYARVARRQIEAGRTADAQKTLVLARPTAVRVASADYVQQNPDSFAQWAATLSDPRVQAYAYLGAAEGILGRPYDPDDGSKWWESGSLRSGKPVGSVSN